MVHLSSRDYVCALELGLQLLSLAAHRRSPRISEAQRRNFERLQPKLARLYRQAGQMPGGSRAPSGQVTDQVTSVHLTPRESDVMRWLACGKTDAEIALLLGISPRTVHKHLEHIYEKLGVETRTAAVMRLHAEVNGTSSTVPEGRGLPARPAK